MEMELFSKVFESKQKKSFYYNYSDFLNDLISYLEVFKKEMEKSVPNHSTT